MELPSDNISATSAEPPSDLKYYYSKRNSPVNSLSPTPSSPLSRQNTASPPHAPNCDMFQFGGFYEIDHSQLLPKYPIHLKDVRVVKVTEKTRLNVTVSFPSAFSLRRYFGEERSTVEGESPHPHLDEQFVMGFDRAGKILKREVPLGEVEREMGLESFWLVVPKDDELESSQADVREMSEDSCLLILKRSGAFNWGVRRKIKYFGRHREEIPSLGVVVKEEEPVGRKRTREIPRKRGRKKEEKSFKKMKLERKGVKTPKDRWSSERYVAAETKLLQIMREKGAVLGNPILRPELREEARKHIGDTGLLDHLLKHMAGKVVLEGKERFRRRHNPEGAMEYWLEAAELQELRTSAGVTDPFWIPPLGWKPGDSISPCSVACGKEVDGLKEELGFLRREIDWLRAVKVEEELQNAQTRNDASSILELQGTYESLTKANAKLEAQVAEIAKRLHALQEEMKELKSDKERKEQEREREEKASNRAARKSGFRICKPQGTFMWPNMGSGSTTGGEDAVGVPPTPHSASSATSPPPIPFIDVSSVAAPRAHVVVVAPRPHVLSVERTDSSDNACSPVLSSPKKAEKKAAWGEPGVRARGWNFGISTDLALSSPCYLR